MNSFFIGDNNHTQRVNSRSILSAILLLQIFLYQSLAIAESAFTGNITVIASSQLFAQKAVIFQMDKGNSDCASGQWIYYYSDGEDLKAMYATVLAARLAGRPIWVHFSSANCKTDSIVVY